MGYIHKEKIHNYWSTSELIETPIFRKIIPEMISAETNRYAEQAFDLRPEENRKSLVGRFFFMAQGPKKDILSQTINQLGHEHKIKREEALFSKKYLDGVCHSDLVKRNTNDS